MAATDSTNEPKDIAKSFIVFEVSPLDSDTDLTAMEKAIRTIEADGLVWGQAEQVPIAYGLYKLKIACVIEDDKVGADFLEEKIAEFEEYVQSVDITTFNKI